MSSSLNHALPGWCHSSALEVSLLGLTELAAALTLQDRMAADLAERQDRRGVLLLCEHPLGISFGREGSAADLFADRYELTARGVPVEWLRRGSGAWAHHGGQLVAYLLVPYLRCGLSALAVRDRLVASLVDVAREFGVAGEPAERPGVRGRCGQFGFVGVSVGNGITQFGACLNVSVPRGVLQLVRWGPDVRPSCLAAERMRPTAMAAVRESWVRHLAARFEYEQVHVWTGHPWLRRTVRRGVVCVES
uniref:BPL/LPL catalytic domain-containing protein n=1 Tax=Schlesneria paludicola TaxID=360056 RepID=A0A7C4LLY8_9PLAN